MPRATEDIVEEAVEQELADIRQPKRAPRWLFETLKDNKLDAPLQTRTRAAAKRDLANSVAHALIAIAFDEEPVCHKDVFSNELWMNPMQAELDSIHGNDTWKLSDLPACKHAVGTKWVYKVKHHANGS